MPKQRRQAKMNNLTVVYGEFCVFAAEEFCKENNIGCQQQLPLNNLLVEFDPGTDSEIIEDRIKFVKMQLQKELKNIKGSILFFRGKGYIQDSATKTMKDLGLEVKEVLVNEREDIRQQERKRNIVSRPVEKESWLNQ